MGSEVVDGFALLTQEARPQLTYYATLLDHKKFVCQRGKNG